MLFSNMGFLDRLSARHTGPVAVATALAFIPVAAYALEQQRETALAIGGLYGLVLGTALMALAVGIVNDEERQRRGR